MNGRRGLISTLTYRHIFRFRWNVENEYMVCDGYALELWLAVPTPVLTRRKDRSGFGPHSLSSQ